MMRLDRFLAEASSMTRSQVKDVIRAGRVRVCSAPAVKGDVKIDPAKDEVELDGERVYLPGERWIMLCKEEGYVTARKDDFSPCVTEFLGKELSDKVFPVGRLDKNTTGLLLFCDDGQTSHRLLSPSRHVSKTYIVLVEGCAGERETELFREGIDISNDGSKEEIVKGNLSVLHLEDEQLPDWLRERISVRIRKAGRENAMTLTSLTIWEGKYHQVKRMFEKTGHKVVMLHRSTFGPLILDAGLLPGMSRSLSEEEIRSLKDCGSASIRSSL